MHCATVGATGTLHPAPFRRPASVVRNGRCVLNRAHFQAGGTERADGGLASRARTVHLHVKRAHTVIARLIGGVSCVLLRIQCPALSRSAEAERTGALPRHLASL